MKAGRELDALVAEKVMGLDVEPSSKYDGWYDDLIPIGDRMFVDPQGWVYDKGKEVVPCYSTNIAAAWPIHKAASRALFTDRQSYFKELEGTIIDRIASEVNMRCYLSISWPDLLMYLEPVDICVALLRVKGVVVAQKQWVQESLPD